MTRTVYLIYGPPRAGKTTYVRNRAKPSDIIVDIDALANAISTGDPHDKTMPTLRMCLDLQDYLIDSIAKRKGEWETAYVIGGYAREGQRKAMAKKLGAVPIHIKADMDTCIKRAEGMPGYDRAIVRWFDEFNGDKEDKETFLATPAARSAYIRPLDAGEIARLKKQLEDGQEKRFYDSARWKKVRSAVLDLDHHECVRCKQKYGHIRKAEYVHHVHELKDSPELACSLLDSDGLRNLISVCGVCHNQLHPEKAYAIRTERIQKPLTEEWW